MKFQDLREAQSVREIHFIKTDEKDNLAFQNYLGGLSKLKAVA